MQQLSELEILRFLLQIGLLLAASRVLADLMKRIGQAAVIGELLAGILLGPSLLGHLAPALYALVFPPDLLQMHLLESLAWLGAVTLLLFIGLETDLGILRGLGRTVTLVSGFGVAIPLGSGVALGLMIPAHHLVAPEQRIIFALFLGVAISISAVPVIAKILLDLGLMRRDLGMLILAAGVLDDSIGWLLLSIVAGLAERGVIDVMSVSRLLAETAAFLAFCYFVGTPLAGRFLRWVDDRTYVEHAKFSAMLAIALGCAVVAQAIGLHAVFGAFIAGLMLTQSARVKPADVSELETVATGFLAPIFFAYSGLRTDLSTLTSPAIAILILVVGCATKLFGCGVGGKLGGLKWREALAVAIGMNARGGMGIIVALVGLTLGVLTPSMYTVLILFAMVTSLMTPPLLSWAIGETTARPSEADRIEREKLLERLPFSHEGTKLLVLSGGGPHADLAAHIAAALANHKDASVTIFRAATPAMPAKSAEFDEQFARMKAIAEQAGAKNVHQRVGSADSIAEAITLEAARGYDAIFAGASHQGGYDNLGGEVLRSLVSSARAPVVIVRGGNTAVPFTRVLTPTTGAAFARLGATVAMQYARVFGSQVTALYVRESSMLTVPVFGSGGALRAAEGREFVDEIGKLGQELGVNVEARVGAGRKPESVILATAAKDDIGLLVMGVLFRSSDERLFFGRKVREIIRKARCAVAVVVPPQQTKAGA
ncbi:MAG TPA: cation:proton antiporter [Candidatus Binataceae bacterium]|nr:cation:proton antiporter [Candidatus Binataceae bacterium]